MALFDEEEQPEGLDIQSTQEALYVYKNYSQQKISQRDDIRKRSVQMPKWPMKEDIVVSGMSGRFPESENIDEFAYNLYNNIDMVVADERRWPIGFLGLPDKSGKIKDISSFDNKFFNITEKEANLMDCQIRIMLEITFEALWDAGIDPSTMAGSNTGVFLGHCFDEFLAAYADSGVNMPDYRQCFFAMLHNIYGFRGPAKHFDSACASGFSALHEAVVSLRSGECDQAVVIGANICLRAGTQHQFLALNMLSPDGHCKCLDDDANGYAKGEACVAVILQKKSEAKRIYATILHTKTNCDGYKELGITFPSFELQKELIEDTYKEAQLDPLQIEYCEAHCTGTQAGDPSEMRAIVESMCVGRSSPLLIGAIKSVIGHTEASSGLSSLIKTILCFETEMIPANLHMKKINHRIDGLVSGILKPIITNQPFNSELIALNCFGFGGVNVHAIIKRNTKEPISANDFGKLPRLVLFCGRNPETLKKIYQFIIENSEKITSDFLCLLNEISKTSCYPTTKFKGMRYRACLMLKADDESSLLKPITEMKMNKVKDKVKPPICFIYTGMGCQWTAMGKGLDTIPIISEVLEKCSQTLKELDPNFDLMNVLTNDDPKILQSPTNSFVAIASIQIALTEFLKHLNIEPDFFVGHSIGELCCAYADGCLTIEQTIICAYIRGKCAETLTGTGKMAAIGCTWEQAIEYCEKYSKNDVWPACHNSLDSVTIAGTPEGIDSFLKQVQENEPELFVRLVNSSDIAFHCPLVEKLGKSLLDQLDKIFEKNSRGNDDNKIISSKWLSTTYLVIDNDNSQRKFQPKYLVDNLIKPVRFHEIFGRIPTNAIYIEIAPHNLLHSIIKRNIMEQRQSIADSSLKYISAMSKPKILDQNDIGLVLLENFAAELYLNGLNPSIENLYPKIQWPVARKTPSFHSMIRWNHDKKFKCTMYPEFFNHSKKLLSNKTIDLQHSDEKFLADHCIDGRILFPTTGYLFMAWEIMAMILKINREDLPIIFEDVILHRATIMPKSGITDFIMNYSKENGNFVIMQGGIVTVTCKIKIPDNYGTENSFLRYQNLLNDIERLKQEECLVEMKNKDIYKEFRLRGYDYGPEFQSIQQLNVHCKCALAKVNFKNWITLVDGMIQTAVLGKSIRGLYVPVRLKYLACDPKILEQQSTTVVDTLFDGILNIGVTKGIEFQGIKANLAPRKVHIIPPSEESYEFVPNDQFDLLYATSRSNSLERRKYLTNCLMEYQDLCAKMVANNGNQSSIDDDHSTLLEEYEQQISEPILMKILKQINFENFEKCQLIDDIEKDVLFTTYLNELFLRTQLEIVTENNPFQTTIEILEVGQTKNIISNQILKLISLDTFRLNFNYRLLHSSLNILDQEQIESIFSQHEWQAEKSKFPTDLRNLDLIIYKDSSLCPLLAEQQEINFDLMLESLWNCLKDNGFGIILLRNELFPFEKIIMEKLKIDQQSSPLDRLMEALNKSQFQIIGHKSDKFSVNVLFVRKIPNDMLQFNEHYFIKITSNINDWFEQAQNLLKEVSMEKEQEEDGGGKYKNGQKLVWLLSDEYNSGIIGFVNCLRREPLGKNVRCILNLSNTNRLNLDSEMIRKCIKQNLYMNVLMDSNDSNDGITLGSYRHFSLPLNECEPKPVEHCYLNVVTRGDLSSLKWFESQHKYWPQNRKSSQQTLCQVYYAPLNFRDIMLATGKLPPDALPDDMGLDDCILGLEFSGRDENGNRVMGMVPSKGLASSIVLDNTKFLWPIPTEWSMEEACTVPVAYATAYYALIIRGKLQPQEKVLIHSGSGAVGQAAIAICLSYNCHLFITVGSDEKRKFLMEKFPDLKPQQFASSRNTEFEKLINQSTNGIGVDIVLNSLAEEKLHASINCLASFGRFLEIGKFDLSQDNKLDLSKIMKNKTFHGILLDNLFNFNDDNVPKIIDKHRNQIRQLINDGIKNGVVKPLNRTIFPVEKCEEAFRFMANGKHTGKVVICIREEENNSNSSEFQESFLKNSNLKLLATPRTVFYSNKSYIITGGLGGFGLELINWMIERDARRFIITSRNGIKDLYQKTRLKYFSEQYGAIIKIAQQEDITKESVESLLNDSLSIGPLGGIFHLAMVLNDGLFDNQKLETFENVIKVKATTFMLLDQLTRQKQLNPDYFVAFSSVSCGLGNPGQTNYGYANSSMERICEKRKQDGLHGFAIQWGAIGDVGYIIDNIRGNDIIVCGSIPQRIPSCLNSLDRLLQNSQLTVCSSLLKADYKFEINCGKTSLIKTVAHILGIKDYDTLEKNITLGELGMDSLMAVEIKQAVERDYDIVLSMQDIRKLTIGRILEISKLGKQKSNNNNENNDGKCNNKNDDNKQSIDEKFVPIEPIVYLNDIINGDPILFLPQLDATYDQMSPIAQKLNRPAIGLNWTKDCSNLQTVPETAKYFIKLIENLLPNLTSNWDLIAYSFGGVIAIEMGLQLQQKQNEIRKLKKFNKLILLDSSPRQFQLYTDEVAKRFSIKDRLNERTYVETMVMFLMGKLPIDMNKIRENLMRLKSNDERNQFVCDLFKQLENINIKKETIEFLMNTHYNKLLMLNQYRTVEKQYQGDLLLIRASNVLLKDNNLVKEDYWISEIIDGKCHLHILKGDHKSFITDNYDQLTEIIRNYIS